MLLDGLHNMAPNSFYNNNLSKNLEGKQWLLGSFSHDHKINGIEFVWTALLRSSLVLVMLLYKQGRDRVYLEIKFVIFKISLVSRSKFRLRAI